MEPARAGALFVEGFAGHDLATRFIGHTPVSQFLTVLQRKPSLAPGPTRAPRVRPPERAPHQAPCPSKKLSSASETACGFSSPSQWPAPGITAVETSEATASRPWAM